jgi:hypothetical protein
MDKRSVVMRVPIELVQRVNIYEKTLAGNGVRMGKTDVMRNFAVNAITPNDNIVSALTTLNNASKKRR